MSTETVNLELAERHIMANGPTRVVINADGEAVPWPRAHQKGIFADIIFIRRDGWSLGAPAHLEEIAYRMWRDEWVGFIRRPSEIAQPIREYKGPAAQPGVTTGA